MEHICENYVHIPVAVPAPYDDYGPPLSPPIHHDAYSPTHHHDVPPHHSQHHHDVSPHHHPHPHDSYGPPAAPHHDQVFPVIPHDGYSLVHAIQDHEKHSQHPVHHENSKDDPNIPKAPPLFSLPQALSENSALNPLAVQLFSRSKRNAQMDQISESDMREMLTKAIFEEMKANTEDELLKNLGDMFSARAKGLKTEESSPKPSILGGSLSDDAFPFLEKSIVEELMRRKELTQNTSISSANDDKSGNNRPSIGGSVIPDKGGLRQPGVLIGVPLPVAVEPPPPIVSVEELPSDNPGCRTLATKTCFKTPIVVNNKVSWNCKCENSCQK